MDPAPPTSSRLSNENLKVKYGLSQGVPGAPKTTQVITIILNVPLELDSKALLPKITLAWVLGHRGQAGTAWETTSLLAHFHSARRCCAGY